MPRQKHVSETPATHYLRIAGRSFGEHPYEYVDHGGAIEAANQLGVAPHQLAKTLIMEDERGHPLIVLMHGDCEVSTKSLARQTGAKKIRSCTPETAQRHTGYMVGGISPFGVRRHMPVWMQASLLEYDIIYLNGGRRGYLISLPARVVCELLKAETVDVALKHE